MTFNSPAFDDIRALPTAKVFSLIAELNPNHPFGYILDNGSVKHIISWKRYIEDARAIAFVLQDGIQGTVLTKQGSVFYRGEHRGDSVVVAVLGDHGYCYAVHFLALMMLCWVPLLLAPTNGTEGMMRLINDSHAHHLLFDNFLYEKVLGLSDSHVKVTEFVSIEEARSRIDQTLVEKRLPYEILETARMNRPAFLLHTSGSTGHPKIVPLTARGFLNQVEVAAESKPFIGECTSVSMSSLSHTGAMTTNFVWPCAVGATAIYTATPLASTVSNLLSLSRVMRDYLTTTKSKSPIIATSNPLMLSEIASSGDDAIRELATTTDAMVYSGNKLPKQVGDKLVTGGVNVFVAYGTTETGRCIKFTDINLDRTNGEWEYVQFHSGYEIAMLPTDTKGVFELVIACGRNTPSVITHEIPRGFATHDLWTEHPTKPGFWKVVGRSGQVSVTLDGGKTNNAIHESMLCEDPAIASAVIFGHCKPHIGAIISPSAPHKHLSTDEFIEFVWKKIESDNQRVFEHNRILKHAIIVEREDKPFLFTGKGTVKCQAVRKLYEDDIERVYNC